MMSNSPENTTQPQLSEEAQAELRSTLENNQHKDKEEGRVEIDADPVFAESIQKPVPQVEVTQAEKETFLEAVLMDQPFQLSFPIFGGRANVVIRSRQAWQTERAYKMVAASARKAKSEGTPFDSMVQLQKYCIMYGLVSFGEREMPPSPEKSASQEDIDAWVEDQFGKSMSNNMWLTLVQVFHTFTQKEKLLLENVANEDFWNPAGKD